MVAWWLLFWRNFLFCFCFIISVFCLCTLEFFSYFFFLLIFFARCVFFPIQELFSFLLYSSFIFGPWCFPLSCLQTNINFIQLLFLHSSHTPPIFRHYYYHPQKELAKLKKNSSQPELRKQWQNSNSSSKQHQIYIYIFTEGKPQYNSEWLERAQ